MMGNVRGEQFATLTSAKMPGKDTVIGNTKKAAAVSPMLWCRLRKIARRIGRWLSNEPDIEIWWQIEFKKTQQSNATQGKSIFIDGLSFKKIGEQKMKDLLFKKSLFSQVDYSILRSAVKRLPGLLPEIVEMRFWKCRTLIEISDEIGVSVRNIELALSIACRILREECLRHPAFSRSQSYTIQGFHARLAA